MQRLYRKSELTFGLVWIGLYGVLQALAGPLDRLIGTACSASAAFCLLQALFLLRFIRRSGLMERYGLRRPSVAPRRLLYYLPLVLLASVNLWNGAAVRLPTADMVCTVCCMLCVGFMEELLFRGFLFKALAERSVKAAVLVSSAAFGLGHLLNLFNGSGTPPAAVLCQVLLATVTGFLFVLLFHLSGSLLPCIAAHGALNAASVFTDGAGLTAEKQLFLTLLASALAAAYALYLIRALPGAARRPDGGQET